MCRNNRVKRTFSSSPLGPGMSHQRALIIAMGIRPGSSLMRIKPRPIGTLALVMVLSDAAPGAVALFPADDFAARLPDGAAIVGGGAFWVAVRSDRSDLGLGLYRAGGKLVLPAGLPGCLPLPGPA